MSKRAKPARVEVNKEELEYFNGYFDCYRVVKHIVARVESDEAMGIPSEWLNEALKQLEQFKKEMFDILKDRYGKYLKYDNKLDRWVIYVEEKEKVSE